MTVTVAVPPVPLATATQLLVAPNPATVGRSVTFTAIVTVPGGGIPSGTVTFTLDGIPQAPVPLGVVDGLAQATLATEALGIGRHTVSASYSGGPGFVASASVTIALVVNPTLAPDGDGPLVTAVRRFGFHAQPTRLVLTFNEDLDPVMAANPANYRLVRRGRDGRFGTRDDRVIGLREASYDAASRTVTLSPVSRLRLRQVYRVILGAMATAGIADRAGNPLDGDGDGQPGGVFVAAIDRSLLAGPVRPARRELGSSTRLTRGPNPMTPILVRTSPRRRPLPTEAGRDALPVREREIEIRIILAFARRDG